MTTLGGRRKIGLIIVLALLIGVGVGVLMVKSGFSRNLPLWSSSDSPAAIYANNDNVVLSRMQSTPLRSIGWKTLLPKDEAALMGKYQPNESKPLSEQVFQSIQASFDNQYQSLQTSVNTVQNLDNTPVSLSGFIVPLEVSDQREILSFFLVPYYGACIHFPPPAPNQIVYVRSPGGFTLDGSSDAYTVTGLLQVAMFEDPMGTSAYLMDAVRIMPFSGQPDDVRNHQLQTY